MTLFGTYVMVAVSAVLSAGSLAGVWPAAARLLLQAAAVFIAVGLLYR